MNRSFLRAALHSSLAIFLSLSPGPAAQAAVHATKHSVQIQFLDSETGYAIQPELRVTKDGEQRAISGGQSEPRDVACSHWIAVRFGSMPPLQIIGLFPARSSRMKA